MALARFLQISDLHLGRPFAWLPPDRREQRRRDQMRALEQAVSQAMERGAHAILVPGDLFDAAAADAQAIVFAIKAFSVHGCPPVFIAPGNHDPASSDNPAWNARLLQVRGLSWPEHVHIFDTPHWTACELPKLPGVRVWGRCFTSNVESTERPLSRDLLEGAVTPDAMGFDLALFHGSREGRCPPSQKITAPFSDDEVAASPFTYHAVGHYHAASRIEQAPVDGVVSTGARLAYAGSPIALDYTETGSHGALEVRVEYSQRRPLVEVEPIELDRRRVIEAHADITGCASPEQVDRRIVKGIDAAGASDGDLVLAHVSGRLPSAVRWTGPGPDARGRVFHLRTDLSGVRPEYDLAALRAVEARTTEERFAQDLFARIDAESDPERRAELERALWYGLDAFRLHEVSPLWEEVTP